MGLYLIAALFSSLLGPFQTGYNQKIINVPHKNIKKFIKEAVATRHDIDLSPNAIITYHSYAMSIYVIGQVIGIIFASRIADRFGRIRGQLYPQIFSLLGAILMGLCRDASSFELLLIGRLFIGISTSILMINSRLYLVEIAPIHIRGAIGALGGFGCALGNFTSTVLGLENILGGDNTWPILLGLASVPSILQCITLPFIPETPRYLILSKVNLQEAEDALKKLRNTDDVKQEITDIQNEEKNIYKLKKYSICQILGSSHLRLSVIFCVCLFLSQQLSGLGGVFSYTTALFDNAGLDTNVSQYAVIGISVIALAMTLIVIPLMDRLGRRTLYLCGLGGIVICNTMITVELNFISEEYLGFFLVGTTYLFAVFFSIGLQSIPLLVTLEIFTQGPRSAASSVATLVCVFTQFVVALIFPQLQIHLQEFCFLPFLIISLVFFVIFWFYFPETKKRTSTELALLFQAPNAWKTPIGLKKFEAETMKKQIGADHGEEKPLYIIKD